MTFAVSASCAITAILNARRIVYPSDVWAHVRRPRDPRALGSVFRALSKAGKIRQAGFRICPRPERNGGVERGWCRARAV